MKVGALYHSRLETPLFSSCSDRLNTLYSPHSPSQQANFTWPLTRGNIKIGTTGFKSQMPRNTIIQGEKFSHWFFVRIGNRYPATPGTPETWQGWMALEESLTPSTMRDEIRLTRILIQYCDTEDDAVLQELKDWFAGMNEVQRTVMAKNMRDLAWDTRGTALFPSFRAIYQTVREHDIADKPQWSLGRLQTLGLMDIAL